MMEQGQDNEVILMAIPKETLQEIISGWRNHGNEDYLSKFADLLANGRRFQFDDIWFFKLATNCLSMELCYNSNESKYVCPVLKACCRLLTSSFFRSHPSYVDELYQKIKLFIQYFEKVFSAEDIVAVELFLQVYCCLREYPRSDFADKKYETSLQIVVRKLMSIADRSIGITVKRVMLKLIIFFIEESGKSNTFSTDLEEFVYDYPNTLRSCGDYEFQFVYTEAVLRLSQYFPRQTVGQKLAPADSDLFKSFMSIDEKAVDKTCRMFLNKFNSWDPTNPTKVFSFQCVALSFGKIPLKKTNTNNLWVDINQGSSCISFCCDVSTECEDEKLVSLLIPSADIHHVTCLKHNVNLGLKVELLKACTDYHLSKYDHFKAMNGSTAVFIFEEHEDLLCISQALNAIKLELIDSLSQESASEADFMDEASGMVKASQVNFPVRPFASDAGNEDFPSTNIFENDETQAIEYKSTDGENWNLNSQEARSAAKTSIAENLFIFHSHEIMSYPSSDKCKPNPTRDNSHILEKMPDSMDRNTSKSYTDFSQHMENYINEQNQKVNKASLAVDMVTCHGISNIKNHLSPVQSSSVEDICVFETPLQPMTSPVMNATHINILLDNIVPSKDRDAESKQKKRKSECANAVGPMQKRLVESSSEGELPETKCKRKCKFTEKRANRRYSLKTAKNKPISSFDKTDSEHFKKKNKSFESISRVSDELMPATVSPIIENLSNILFDSQNNTFDSHLEKKNEFGCDVKFIEDGTILTPEKRFTNSATQCTPSITVNYQNTYPIDVPWFHNKSTMCSPGLLSGPSTTVKPTLSMGQSYERVTTGLNDLFHFGQSSSFKPSNTFRRRLAFEDALSRPPNTISRIDPELNSFDVEQNPCLLVNCNAIHEFGKKISRMWSEKFTELSMKQITTMKCIFKELQELWDGQLKTSMEMEEQLISHLDSFMTEFQKNLKIKFNLQNQQVQSASLILDKYDTFLSDMNGMEKEFLTSTKNAENDLASSMSLAKNELLNSIQSSVQKYLQKRQAFN